MVRKGGVYVLKLEELEGEGKVRREVRRLDGAVAGGGGRKAMMVDGLDEDVDMGGPQVAVFKGRAM